jgi:hypothetical protein
MGVALESGHALLDLPGDLLNGATGSLNISNQVDRDATIRANDGVPLDFGIRQNRD